MCLVWSTLCGVNVFAQSCPVCCHQLDLFFNSHPLKAQTGFLKPGLDSQEASTLSFQQFRKMYTDLDKGIRDQLHPFNPTADGYKLQKKFSNPMSVSHVFVHCIFCKFNYPNFLSPAKSI